MNEDNVSSHLRFFIVALLSASGGGGWLCLPMLLWVTVAVDVVVEEDPTAMCYRRRPLTTRLLVPGALLLSFAVAPLETEDAGQGLEAGRPTLPPMDDRCRDGGRRKARRRRR
jgi:hypothetical protein